MEFNAIEILGYISTFFVASSFLFKSIVHLRIVNCFGSFLYCLYGFFIDSMPVVLLNAFLVGVNLYQLWRLKTAK